MVDSAARARLVVALDTPDLADARALAARLKGEIGMVKVGLELFTAHGPAAVRAMREAGHEVFLDLKLHDIPNTVRAAARQAGRLGARLLTIHAAGGPDMIRAAVQGCAEGAGEAGVEPPTVLAVTVLTSLDAAVLQAVGLAGPPRAAVERLAVLAVRAGAGGIVCAPPEVTAVRALVGPDAQIVTPGIRPAGTQAQDQARIATPHAAIAAGADRIVVGRPIREAADPVEAARRIVADIATA